jgi:hypothetical protein
MRRFRAALLTAAAGLLMTIPVRADLLGTVVTGSMTFPSTDGYNYYGSAPRIIGNGTEFSYTDDWCNYISADFTSDGLVLYEHIINYWIGATPWTQTFVSPAFNGAVVTETDDDFINRGVSWALAGDTLTFNWNGIGWLGEDPAYDAQYHIAVVTGAVPEPSTLVALAAALVGLGFGVRRKNLTPKS